MTPDLSERLFWRETLREILDLFTDREWAVAQLRLEAVPDDKIAEMLDISPHAVRLRMARAERRIVRALPEMAHFFQGRELRPSRHSYRTIPLEQGWLCSDLLALRDTHPFEPCYRASQVAAWCGMNISVVRAWCRAGKLPGARKRRGQWLIPEEAVQVAREAARAARRRRGRRA